MHFHLLLHIKVKSVSDNQFVFIHSVNGRLTYKDKEENNHASLEQITILTVLLKKKVNVSGLC